VPNVALAICGFWRKASSALRMTLAASAAGTTALNASRSRRTARACSCDTRDSFTPISDPISFIVTSP
jgi:hypothetical protein